MSDTSTPEAEAPNLIVNNLAVNQPLEGLDAVKANLQFLADAKESEIATDEKFVVDSLAAVKSTRAGIVTKRAELRSIQQMLGVRRRRTPAAKPAKAAKKAADA